MPNENLSEKMKVVTQLVEVFKMERIVHLVISSVSLVMLLFSAATLIFRNKADVTVLSFLFGSSGLVGYSTNRLLRMWDQAIRIVMSSN